MYFSFLYFHLKNGVRPVYSSNQIYRYKMQRDVFYCVTVFDPKDDAIIELKFCQGQALSCLPVQPPLSQSQLSMLPQAEPKERSGSQQDCKLGMATTNSTGKSYTAAQKLHITYFTKHEKKSCLDRLRTGKTDEGGNVFFKWCTQPSLRAETLEFVCVLNVFQTN